MAFIFGKRAKNGGQRKKAVAADIAALEEVEQRFFAPDEAELAELKEFINWDIAKYTTASGQHYKVFGRYFSLDDGIEEHLETINGFFTDANLGNEPVVFLEEFGQYQVYLTYCLNGSLVRDDLKTLEDIQEYIESTGIYGNGPAKDVVAGLSEERLTRKLTG